MVAKNDITGDSIQSRGNSKAYQENLEKIFGEKKRYCDTCGKTFSWCQCGEPDDKLTRYNEETQEALKMNSK